MPVSTVLFDVGDVVCRFRPARRLAALAAVSPYPAEELRAIWALAFEPDPAVLAVADAVADMSARFCTTLVLPCANTGG
jgi:hypothetical protein